MSRMIRYRQVLKYRTKEHGKGTYKNQVFLQKCFWLEDCCSTLSIQQVREAHEEIGTWDKNTKWESFNFGGSRLNNIEVMKPYKVSSRVKNIKPKANYKSLKKAKEDRWKEQERRTLEFFESMGV